MFRGRTPFGGLLQESPFFSRQRSANEPALYTLSHQECSASILHP